MTASRVANSQEVLALVPFQLGFVPDNSVVVVAFNNSPGGLTVGEMKRIDLHVDAEGGVVDWVRSAVVEADAAVVVVYSPDVAWAETFYEPSEPNVQVLAVDGGHFTDLSDEPPVTRQMIDPAETVIGARMILRGESFAPSREAFFDQD